MSDQPQDTPAAPEAAHEPEGTPLAPEEIVARGIISSRLYNKETKSLKPAVFDPPRDGNLSVTRHKDMDVAVLWERCRDVIRNQQGRTLYGRADISSKNVTDSGPSMAAVAAWRPHNPGHAHIIGWPTDEALLLEVQTVLAANAVFFPVPSPPPC
jgi:hypothetical protein